MINRITEILNNVNNFVFKKENNAASFRLLYLSKKGVITELLNEFKTIPNNEKKLVGAQLNILKQKVEEIYQHQTELEEKTNQSKNKNKDGQGVSGGETPPAAWRQDGWPSR